MPAIAPLDPVHFVDPTTLPSSWTTQPLLKADEAYQYQQHHVGPIAWGTTGSGNMSGQYGLAAGKYGSLDSDGKFVAKGSVFAPVVKLDAANQADAVIAAKQLAALLPKLGDRLLRYEQPIGGGATHIDTDSDNPFGRFHNDRPIVAVLQDEPNGPFYAAAFSQAIYPHPQSNVFGSMLVETASFTPLQNAVKAVVQLGQSVDTPTVGAPVTITVTH